MAQYKQYARNDTTLGSMLEPADIGGELLSFWAR